MHVDGDLRVDTVEGGIGVHILQGAPMHSRGLAPTSFAPALGPALPPGIRSEGAA
jgi:hypothetical protein